LVKFLPCIALYLKHFFLDTSETGLLVIFDIQEDIPKISCLFLVHSNRVWYLSCFIGCFSVI
jgi:hypothetical protein